MSTLFPQPDRTDVSPAEPPRPRPWWRRRIRIVWLRPIPPSRRRAATRATFLVLLGMSALFGALCGLVLVYSIDLPQMEDLARYRPNTTTELYDVHGKIFGSFALERRIVVPYNAISPLLRDAIISIEDKSFESNWGVNLFRAVGAAWRDLHSAGRAQGASTLTMQLARNLFLSSQKTYGRKLQEIFLSVQMERRFTKQQLFTLYANQIYLGHGTYGFEAGAEYFFSKHARDLTLPEAALLAALPKGPEYYSPIRYPQRALRRRNLVLSEMLLDGKITATEAAAAKATPLILHVEVPTSTIAPYFVEEVRRQLEKQYGAEAVHGAGLKVYTTLDLDLQRAANAAVLDGVAAYERRRGWKGNLTNILDAGQDLATYRHPDWKDAPDPHDYLHGLIIAVDRRSATVKLGTEQATLTPADYLWTQKISPDKFLRVGDIVYVRVESIGPEGAPRVTLQQDTGAQGSMMAVNNSDGEILAMVGGRDYNLSQFNRATQAQRQVGSSFKPYVYTAAVEAGTKPYDTILDAPTTFSTPGGPYTPHNYEPNYRGNMSIIDAFAESRNIPALKLAARVGIRKVIEVAHRFGITSNIPAFLPVAIGSADITLAEQVGAYEVFPNDGIRIEPHAIRKVTQSDGLPLEEKAPRVTEVISVETARTMMTLLQAVTRVGTAAAAQQLHHALGGKTGTTNNFTDAWFIGFSPSVTCGTWIGFDDRQSLGKGEQGAKAALPMWMDFMRVAIANHPNETFSTAGAPRRSVDVPVTPAAAEAPDTDATKPSDADPEDTAAPDAKPAPTDDTPNDGPAPAPSASPSTPAPQPQ